MEDQPAATRHCSNCKRDVAEGNFVMHEVHCRKNIVLCSKCNEPVPKSGLEEHIEENHALVNCELCSCLVERSRLDEHKGSLCSKRCRVCAFCELSVPSDELGKHESYCGTRTELCTKCLQYIMHKDRLTHEDSDCRLPERIDQPPKADADPFDPPGYSYFDHPDHWSDYRSFANEVQRSDIDRSRQERLVHDFSGYELDQALGMGRGLNGILARRNAEALQSRTGVDRLQREKQAKEDKLCDDFLKFAQAKKLNATKDSKVSRDVHSNLPPQDVSLLPCEFCDETFPGDEIFQHQVICSSQFDEPDFQVKHDYGSNLLSDDIVDPLPTKSSFLESANDESAMLLPCEFCEDLYPTEDLMSHQMNCEVRKLITYEHEDLSPDEMRRPPSLPSGLDHMDNLSNVPYSLKPSSSFPNRLSYLGAPSEQSSALRKPAPAAAGFSRRLPQAENGYRPPGKPPSNLAKKPTTKQLSLADRTGQASREVQPVRQSKDTVGLVPLRPDMAMVRSVPLMQDSSLAPRVYPRGALHAPQRAGLRAKPMSVTEISTCTSSESNHSRGMAYTRPTGTSQLATRPAPVRQAPARQEGDVGTGRPQQPTTRHHSRSNNPRTLPDAPSKS